MSSRIVVALPFWLDRPDGEAMQIAHAAARAGPTELWIGEMASFDAFALATAVGVSTPGLRLKLGPLPISVRTPVSVALGASSVAALTGCEIDVALGASSPVIVTGRHDHEWLHAAARMRETVPCLRSILYGERANCDGRFVRSHGFRLRHPLPHTRVGLVVLNDGAYGAEYAKLERTGFGGSASFVEWPEFAEVGSSLGGRGVAVRTEQQLRDAVVGIENLQDQLVIDIKANPHVSFGEIEPRSPRCRHQRRTRWTPSSPVRCGLRWPSSHSCSAILRWTREGYI